MNKYIILLVFIITIGCTTSKNEETENTKTEKPKVEFRITERYSSESVKQLDSAELRIKRNEIFAQYGYKFKSEELSIYYSSKPWYEPKYDNVDSLLTELDKKNIRILLNEEVERNRLSKFNCSNFPNSLTNFSFNSSIARAVDSLGNPDKTIIHEDLTCPIGQLHFWNSNIKNQQLIILGDDYTNDINYLANSRYYAIQILNYDELSKYHFNQIKLGESERSLKLKVNCLITKNPEYSLGRASGQSMVEELYINDQSNQYIISNGNIYIRFILDSKAKLVAIVYSTINDRLAC
ncbi:MAG: YARHG domain-containing protein [Fulvivirga sp.]